MAGVAPNAAQDAVPAPTASPPSDRKTIFYSLDGIRGVAAVLVVLRHTEQFFAPWDAQESYLAVDVFFVLSGVVIAQAYGARLLSGRMSLREFAWVRLVRIMPLYLLGTGLSIAGALLTPGGHDPTGFFALYVLLGLFMLPNPGLGTVDVYPLNNPAWSLPLELGANAVYARCVARITPRWIAAALAINAAGIVFTLWWAKSHSLNIGFWARSFPFGGFRVGFSFFAGVLLFRILPHLKRRLGHVPFPTACAWGVLVATTAALTAAPSARVQPFYDFFAVAVIFPALVALGLVFQPSGISARVFRLLGLVSYAIYTLHAPLSGIVDSVSHGEVERWAPWSGIAFVLALIPVCVLADRAFDFPVRSWLLRLGRASRGSSFTRVPSDGASTAATSRRSGLSECDEVGRSL